MKSKNFRIFMSVIIGIILIMTIASSCLLGYIRRSLEEDVKVNLMEITNQNAKIITEQVKQDLNGLCLIGELLLSNFSDLNDPRIADFLHTQGERDQLGMLMLCTPTGQGMTSEGSEFDVSERTYFQEAKRGISHISEMVVSKLDGSDVYIGSVPLYRDGTLMATLHRFYSAENFSGEFSLSLFNNRGYINIINEDGEIMVHSAEEGERLANNNYFQELLLLGNSTQVEQIKSDLQTRGSGFIDITTGHGRSFAAYTKINEVYGWSLISAVPSDLISHNANEVTKVVVLLLAVFAGAILIACGLIYLSIDRRNKTVEVMAFVDGLTGGNTYNKMLVEVPKLLSAHEDEQYIMAYLDVDNFKFINNMHGYDYGDSIIQAIHNGLKNLISEKEILARVSADKFVALVKYADQAEIDCRMNQMVTPIVEQAGFLFYISCGIYYIENRNEQIELMIDRAAMAAKTVKGNSKEMVAYYDSSMSEGQKEEESIKQDVLRALQESQFEPFYQPKVDVYATTIVGAEVLVRWRHPEKGLISPADFVPVLEKSGYIVDVDMYMFECVCKKLTMYEKQGIPLIPISVNFSRVHLYNPTFIERIQAMVVEYQVDPSFVEIEITESAMFNNLEVINKIIGELQSFGFVISMDDFGSGFSSLNMLKEIPINILKIDKEFFAGHSNNERREIVIESIVKLAHKLNIHVVAEGIETAEQVAFIQRINCSVAQGFYFARPVPSQEFDEMYLSGLEQ